MSRLWLQDKLVLFVVVGASLALHSLLYLLEKRRNAPSYLRSARNKLDTTLLLPHHEEHANAEKKVHAAARN